MFSTDRVALLLEEQCFHSSRYPLDFTWSHNESKLWKSLMSIWPNSVENWVTAALIAYGGWHVFNSAETNYFNFKRNEIKPQNRILVIHSTVSNRKVNQHTNTHWPYFNEMFTGELFTSFVYNMADSCRPVSRHGRYNSSGPSSVGYGGDVAAFGNVDYTPTDGMIYIALP